MEIVLDRRRGSGARISLWPTGEKGSVTNEKNGTVKLTGICSFSRRNRSSPGPRIINLAGIAISEISMKSVNLTIPDRKLKEISKMTTKGTKLIGFLRALVEFIKSYGNIAPSEGTNSGTEEPNYYEND